MLREPFTRNFFALFALVSLNCLTACESCVARVEERVGIATSPEGTLRLFLSARGEGRSGEEYLRKVDADFPRVDSDGAIILPTAWESVRTESRKKWDWYRFKIDSTNAAGLPIKKLWDFCLHRTVEGSRIAVIEEASEDSLATCQGSLTWWMFRVEQPLSKAKDASAREEELNREDEAFIEGAEKR